MLHTAAATFVLVTALTSACAERVHEEDFRRLDETVNTLRSQLSHESARVEGLSHEILVLTERQAASTVAPGEPSPPPDLQVIHLMPPDRHAASPRGETVTLSMPAGPDADNVGTASVPSPPGVRKVDEAAALLTSGLDFFQNGDFTAASTQFQLFVERYPRHVDADKARYWLGECALEQHAYSRAVEAFVTVLTQFPQSSKRADAMLNAGLAYQHLNKTDEARRLFSELVTSYPRTALADLARARLMSANQGGN
jgi:tol-pal system protein YbgF